MTDATLIENFSSIAARYDSYARVQRRAAEDLLAFTGRPAARRILEPGCGTGIYTRMLLDAYPRASVLGVDISEAMLGVARRRVTSSSARFQVADAEELPWDQYDLITSNATFQWFERLPETMRRLADMLGPDGLLTFSFFGPGTYRELDEALGQVLGDEFGAAASRFHGSTELTAMLRENFTCSLVGERRYFRRFASLKELLVSIKYTGVRGRRSGSAMAWTPGLLARVERACRERHGGIHATYRVLFCMGRK